MPATDTGSVVSSDPTSVSTPTMMQMAATALGVVPGPIGSVANLFSAGTSSALPNYALVAVGAILALGALLISSKDTVIQVATKAGAIAA